MQTATIVRAHDLPWQPSPSPSVWRKRLFHQGPAEAGTVNSLVRCVVIVSTQSCCAAVVPLPLFHSAPAPRLSSATRSVVRIARLI